MVIEAPGTTDTDYNLWRLLKDSETVDLQEQLSDVPFSCFVLSFLLNTSLQ